MHQTRNNTERGGIIIQVLAFASIGIFLLAGFVNWGVMSVKLARTTADRAQALAIAEAGIDYYRWHLAHAPTDFQDGTGAPGPYVHNFEDKNGVTIGTFTLDITAPPPGSTLVTIRSTGRVFANPTVSRTIETRLAKPSLAKYAVVANANMRFGPGTEIFGRVHSNGGIRFDGISHNVMTSAKSSYDDPDHTGNNEFGVHTHVNAPPGTGVNDTFRPNEAPPTSPVPSRPEVFMTGRQFPVPEEDFVGLTADIAQMKADAQANGLYYGPPSGNIGYLIQLKTNDTFDIFRVNALQPNPGVNCPPATPPSDWGTWSIAGTGGATSPIASDVPFPANGLIFVESNLWIEGQINTARLTIVAATFPDDPATRKSITVNNNLMYTNYDGQDVIALIAQHNINVGLKSADNLQIDAALIAQNGRVGRFYYRSGCGAEWVRSSVTLYGMIATNQRYGFTYVGTNYTCPGGVQIGSGYCVRQLTYDGNLLYGPPPSFPLTTDEYQILSWEEL